MTVILSGQRRIFVYNVIKARDEAWNVIKFGDAVYKLEGTGMCLMQRTETLYLFILLVSYPGLAFYQWNRIYKSVHCSKNVWFANHHKNFMTY